MNRVDHTLDFTQFVFQVCPTGIPGCQFHTLASLSSVSVLNVSAVVGERLPGGHQALGGRQGRGALSWVRGFLVPVGVRPRGEGVPVQRGVRPMEGGVQVQGGVGPREWVVQVPGGFRPG